MSRYLDMVDHPSHVKKLTLEQLKPTGRGSPQRLDYEVAKNGGHLGPNLRG